MASSKLPSFTFIPTDWRSKPAQEAIRVHILRHRHRQARRGRKKTPTRTPERQFEEQLHFWELQEHHGARRDGPPRPESPHRTPTAGSPLISNPASDDDLGGCTGVEPSSPSPNAENASQPTSSPTNQSEVEEMLVQYYLRYGGGSHVPQELLRGCRETTGTFSAFLAIIATYYSVEHGQIPPLDTAELENKALQEVSAQIANSPTVPAGSTMVTVGLLANLRECRHEFDLADTHWSALKQMVDINGGVNRLRMHQHMYAFLLWMEAVVLSATLVTIAQPPLVSMYAATVQQELQDFLGVIRQHLRSAQGHSDRPEARLTDPILRIFRRSSHKKDAYSIAKWRRARFASLMFFAVLQQQTKGSLQDDTCYGAIAAEISGREQLYTVFPEELCFIIIQQTNQDNLCEMTWKAMRMVCAARQLGQRDINTCHRLLAASLRVADYFDLELVLDEWDDLSCRVQMSG